MAKVFLTTTEAAARLGISGQTIRNWIKSGLLRGYRMNPGGRLYVLEEDLDDLIERSRYDFEEFD